MASSNNAHSHQRSARRTYGLIQASSSSNLSSSEPQTESTAMTENTHDGSSHPITVTILDSAQNKFEIKISSNATVAQLKTKGALVHSIPPTQQRLISMGQLLQDEKFLSADHNITNGSIVHLFPKPNVVITDSNASSRHGDNPNRSSSTNSGGGTNTLSSPGAHVPQIVMDTDEVNRRSSLLVLSTHEAYEALHRIRLLSFLLLIYSSIQLLRDVSIWLGPPEGENEYDRTIPPGDPTDTSIPGQNQYDPELPEWQNRDYVEMAICALGMYVALLGIKATSEHIGYLARRFVVLLGVLGVSWNAYLIYCYVQELKERESDEALRDGKVYQDALLADSLPLFLWLIFYLRAMQFYYLIREAENDAQERSRSLTSAMVTPGGGNSGEGDVGTSTNERSDTRRDEYDLELQVDERSIT